MTDGAHPCRSPEVASGAQKLMLDAGYEPKDDWIFIEDLVQRYRSHNADRTDLLAEADQFLANATSPVTRAGFRAWCAEITSRDKALQERRRKQKRVAEICANAGVAEPGVGHEALALRIDELERTVQAYAQQLRLAETRQASRKDGSPLPFLAGIVIGSVVF